MVDVVVSCFAILVTKIAQSAIDHFSVCKAHVSLKWGYLKIYASASHNNCDRVRFKQQTRGEAYF